MNTKRQSPAFSRARSQRGAALLFAIAIIVIASLLGAAMARLVRIEQLGVAREVLSTRAMLAADSAAQRVLAQLFGGAACGSNMANYDFAVVAGLAGCSARVDCTELASVPEATYAVIATGSCGSDDPAVRRIEVLAREL